MENVQQVVHDDARVRAGDTRAALSPKGGKAALNHQGGFFFKGPNFARQMRQVQELIFVTKWVLAQGYHERCRLPGGTISPAFAQNSERLAEPGMVTSLLRKKADDFQFRHKHFHFFQNDHEIFNLWPTHPAEIIWLKGLACLLKKNC